MRVNHSLPTRITNKSYVNITTGSLGSWEHFGWLHSALFLRKTENDTRMTCLRDLKNIQEIIHLTKKTLKLLVKAQSLQITLQVSEKVCATRKNFRL